MRAFIQGHTLRLAVCFVATFLLGLAVTFFQMQKVLNQSLQEKLQRAVNSIDTTLQHGEQAAVHASKWLGRPCDETSLTGIRMLVATIPDVRTVNLATGNEIYCTSVFGGRKFKIDTNEYINGKLLLMKGNDMTPARSLIVYRNEEINSHSALAGIDGYYFYSILNVLRGGTEFYIRIGDNIMNSKGDVFFSPLNHDGVSFTSEHYDYSVFANNKYTYSLSSYFKYEKDSLFIIAIFSILITYLFRHYLLYSETIEFRLRNAIKKKVIQPWIQPVIDAKSGKVIGGEVLLRWKDPKLGFISPDIFIATAEQTMLIDKIASDCFNKIIKELEDLNVHTSKPLIIFFNVSAINFSSNSLVELCRLFISHISSEHFRPVLEITEREVVDNNKQTRKVLLQLRQLGVTVALDDFGTGNSNFSYFSFISPEYIKIDKIFTTDLKNNELSKFVVESTIKLAKKFNCQVIAEGVESDEQCEMLIKLGVDYLQGFLFSRPVPVSEFITMLAMDGQCHPMQ